MRYKHKLVPRWQVDAYRMIIGLLLISMTVGVVGKKVDAYQEQKKQEWIDSLVSPLPEKSIKIIELEVDKLDENIPAWVQKYVDQYFTGYQRSEMYMIMHCLLHRESGHQADGSKAGHGDGGKAGGTLQFHEGTWNRMRGQMLKAGLISEIGSRYNTKEAIHTTVWAIKNGRALEWGPILRADNGSDFATCQVPSFYK